MARLMLQSQAAPAAQGPTENKIQEAAAILAGTCGVIALGNPGIFAGALCICIWRALRRPPIFHRLIFSALLVVPLVELQHLVVWAWPWRDFAADSFPGKVARVDQASAMHSFLVEALAGPLWLEIMLVATVVWRRRVDQQIRHDHQLDKLRWRAITGRKKRTLFSDPRAAALHRNSEHPQGHIRLCVDEETNRPFDLELPTDLSTHLFLPGATGTGKTTTIARLGDGVLANGYGLVIIDCKGGGLGRVAQRLAERHHLPFYLVDPDHPDTLGYNPCSGDAASVANKLIGAFSYGPSAEIYKNIAMVTLPVVVRALQARRRPVTIQALYNALAPGELDTLAGSIGDPELSAQLKSLSVGAGARVGSSGQAGLRYRLGALLEGKFRELFRSSNPLDWEQAFSTPSVTYIALSALASSEDVELMGRVLAQDQKQVCARRIRSIDDGRHVVPVLAVWDEFAALNEADQLVDLLLQARAALMPTVVSTQYIPETIPLRKAVLGAGLLIAHRVEGEDAEAIANQFGTRMGGELTSQVDFTSGLSEKGSLRRVDRYNVHPNELRNLRIGQAALMSIHQGRYSIVRVYSDEG